QKVQCCYWLAELKFPVSVRRRFRQEYGQDPPERHTITKWHNKVLETGSVLRKKGSGKKLVTAARIETVWEAYQRSQRKSIRRARLKLKAYKIQLVQKLQPNDKPNRKECTSEMLSCIEDNNFLNRGVFRRSHLPYLW
ncbi:hypothetical protein C0J52_15709, partial [Blattella germanica]